MTDKTPTPEQEALLKQYDAKALKIGLSTERANVREMRRGWNLLYQRANFAPPKIVWMTQGPLAAHVAMRLLRATDPTQIVDPSKFTVAFWEGLIAGYAEALKAAKLTRDPDYKAKMDWLRKAKKRGGDMNPSRLREVGIPYEYTWFWGAHEAHWTEWYRGRQEVLHQEFEADKMAWLDDYEITVKNGLWSWAFEGGVITMDRPIECHMELVKADNSHRLHREDGPALEFLDTYKLYVWHGIVVTPQIICFPETLTVQQINAEENAEIRRVMLERFGMERYLKEANATVRDRSDYGTLFEIPAPTSEDEPFVAVEVTNSTPEPGTGIQYSYKWIGVGENPETRLLELQGEVKDLDYQIDYSDTTKWLRVAVNMGEPVYRKYVIPVPPETETARAGIAWSFGIPEAEYQPLIQT